MGKHILSINIPPVTNEAIFLVDDTSIYDSVLPVGNMNIQITPPGANSPTVITPGARGFRLILNACMLGVAPVGSCSDICPNIPDGIYGVRYSVSPNSKVFVEYLYLRIVSAMNRQRTLLYKMNLPCCLPDKEQEYALNCLNIIEDYLISAQVNVNDKGTPSDGINQYRYAIELMNKLSTRKPFCL